MKKLNDSDTVRVKVGRHSWLSAFELMVFGEDEIGDAIAVTEGPFRTRAIAESYGKIKYRGHKRSVVVTMVDERFARFKGLPRKKTRKK